MRNSKRNRRDRTNDLHRFDRPEMRARAALGHSVAATLVRTGFRAIAKRKKRKGKKEERDERKEKGGNVHEAAERRAKQSRGGSFDVSNEIVRLDLDFCHPFLLYS